MIGIGNRTGGYLRYTNQLLAVAVFCLVFAVSVRPARAADAPVRAARLSYLQGTVTVDQVDNTGSNPAQLNMPLSQGVRVTTGADGQAEIEFEDGSLVRLTPNSSLGLTELTADGDSNFQTKLTLTYGLAYAELRAAEKFMYNLDAGGELVSPVTNATVRILMDHPPAAISVLDGTVQVERAAATDGEGFRTKVNSGETLTADASDPGRYSLTQQIAENSWDNWNDDRDKAAADEAENQTEARDGYAGEAGYGWSDLDANGSWYDVPGEGDVWQPNEALAPDFDPYGYGSWVSYPGTGYVWASGYNWGWTPYRCGNWSYWSGFGWGWRPGASCGYGRWGFGGGGYAINIVRPPRGYRLRPVPVHSPGGLHPIRVGRPVNPIHSRPVLGPRSIAGHTVERMHPVARVGNMRSSRPAGGALRRDFPVDRTSHKPVMGRMAPRETTTPVTGARPAGERPVNPRGGAEGRERPVRPMRPEPPATQREVPTQHEHRMPTQQEQARPIAPQSSPRSSRPAEPRNVPETQQRNMSRPQERNGPRAEPRNVPQQPPPRFRPPPQTRSAPQAPRPAAPPSAPSPRSSSPAPRQ